jgi:DNA-binding MarR family transcriptional regulator
MHLTKSEANVLNILIKYDETHRLTRQQIADLAMVKKLQAHRILSSLERKEYIIIHRNGQGYFNWIQIMLGLDGEQFKSCGQASNE